MANTLETQARVHGGLALLVGATQPTLHAARTLMTSLFDVGGGTGSSCGSNRPIPGNGSAEMPTVQRPFKICGRLFQLVQ